MEGDSEAGAFDPVAYINTPRWIESRLGLERIGELLERLGNPQNAFKAVHVAGTNGKGSTCAMLASVLFAAGCRTGLFTSPYIMEFSDRIKVDGKNITPGQLREVTLAVREAAEAMVDHPTEFELMSAVAFLHFARSGCDIAVVEVGLGGRLDSTNVLETPEVCVITRIGLDHRDILGDTLEAVAREKAGIIKQGIPVISWPQEPGAARVIKEVAALRGSSLRCPDFSKLASRYVGGDGPAAEGLVQRFSYRSYRDLSLSLLGSYQPCNAAVALEAVEVLRQRGWAVSGEAVREGLAHTVWPGRFEIVATRPVFIVDGGHNPQGASALAASLGQVFPGRKVIFVGGVLAEKDYTAMLSALIPLASAFVAFPPPNPRALPAGCLADAVREAAAQHRSAAPGPPAIEPLVARDAAQAVETAYRLAGSEGLICAFGSLYSVAPLKRAAAAHQAP